MAGKNLSLEKQAQRNTHTHTHTDAQLRDFSMLRKEKMTLTWLTHYTTEIKTTDDGMLEFPEHIVSGIRFMFTAINLLYLSHLTLSKFLFVAIRLSPHQVTPHLNKLKYHPLSCQYVSRGRA